jgi:hypothetical protein
MVAEPLTLLIKHGEDLGCQRSVQSILPHVNPCHPSPFISDRHESIPEVCSLHQVEDPGTAFANQSPSQVFAMLIFLEKVFPHNKPPFYDDSLHTKGYA